MNFQENRFALVTLVQLRQPTNVLESVFGCDIIKNCESQTLVPANSRSEVYM